jgi:hypothetical protein
MEALSHFQRAALALALTLCLASPPALCGEAGSLEYAVKANYLFKFAPFVAWPDSAFPSPTSPFNLCVAGDDPFGTALDEAVRGQSFNQHPVRVRRVSGSEGLTSCHILFAAPSRLQSMSDILKGVRGAPVLTVADKAPGSRGAVIQFVILNDRVRFIIDSDIAAANRVSISSKLLSLAVQVMSGNGD